VYFPDTFGDQEKWGGIDLTIDIKKFIGTFVNPNATVLSIVPQQITLHFGLNWPQCFRCISDVKDCSKFSSQFHYEYNPPCSDTGPIYINGFTLHGNHFIRTLLEKGFVSMKQLVAFFKDLFDSYWNKDKPKPPHQSLIGNNNNEDEGKWTSPLKNVLGSLTITPGLAIGTHKGSDWGEKFQSTNPLDYSTMEPICDGLNFFECSIKRSPALTGFISDLSWSLPKIKDYSCDAKACEDMRLECGLTHPDYDNKTNSPSTSPTSSPSKSPTNSPSTSPTNSPSTSPTNSPSTSSQEDESNTVHLRGNVVQNNTISVTRSLVKTSTRSNDVVNNILEVVQFVKSGKISNEFCFGDCSGDEKANRHINGTLEIIPSESCDGIKAVCKAGTVTVASASYVLLNSIDEEMAESVANALDKMGPFGSFGLRNTSIVIEATTNPDLKLVIGGWPNLPAINEDTPGVAQFFIKLLSGVRFELAGYISRDSLRVKLDAVVNMPSDSTSVASFHNTGIYFEYELTPVSIYGSQIFSIGLTSTLKVCVRNCKADELSSRSYILLKGSLYSGSSFSVDMPGPPPANIGGELALVVNSTSGYWHRAFGVPILHLRDAVAGAAINIAMYPPVPSSFILGGSACITFPR